MQNTEIAARLKELADLLEIQGANPFRVRAYRNAVRTIRGLTRPLTGIVASGESLTDLPGIGPDLAGHIGELLSTGSSSLLEELTREVPRELALLTRLEGVGPGKVKKLWKELEVTGIDELEAAVRSGRVQALGGFGAKSAATILRSIESFRGHQGHYRRVEATEALAPLLTELRAVPGVARVEAVGSYRRGAESVQEVTLLAVREGEGPWDGPGVMERFTGFAGVAAVEASGEREGRVVLGSGLVVELRIVPASSYGAALLHLTGSAAHARRLAEVAEARGLRISEDGVHRVGPEEDGGRDRVGGASEEALYEAIGLPWIPPVLREDRGEIQAALEGRLPRLVELEALRGDLHMHTTWSDGRASIEEMALACRERGYEYLAITDHSQAVTVARGLTPGRVREQAEEVRSVRARLEGIHLFHGCEVDVLRDGTLDLPDEILEELDLVLIAVHSHFHLDRSTQTERIVRALSHPAVDILVHPTGRLIHRRDPYEVDIEAVLQAAAAHQVAVELNCNPHRLDLHDGHLMRARELGIPVSLGTDAHWPEQLEQMSAGLPQAQRGWLEASDVLNCRSLAEFTAWLGRRGG